MLTEKSTSQSAGVIERPVIDATHDFQVVDRPILENRSDAASTSTDQAHIGAVQQHWDQVLGCLQAGILRADSPELLALVKDLKLTGVLPNGPLTKDQLLAFHYWLSTMPVGEVALDQLTFLEGAVLQAWGNSVTPPPLDQVVVFDAINAFDQYAVYCQVTMGDDVVTLAVDQFRAIDYDPQAHRGIEIHLRNSWVVRPESGPVDYTQAHQILDLSDADTAALNQWLAGVFPDGVAGLSDDAILLALITAIQQDIDYKTDLGDDWAAVATTLSTRQGDCEDLSHLLVAAATLVFDNAKRPQPELTLLAGVVGAAPMVFGHSLVQWQRGNDTVIIDLLGDDIFDVDHLPTLDMYQTTHGFETYFDYTAAGTNLRVNSNDLTGFSTSDGQQELNEKFQSVFGTDKTLDSVLSSSGRSFSIDSYDALIQKVIAHEMNQLKTKNNAKNIGVIDLGDLDVFRSYDFRDQITALTVMDRLPDAELIAMNDCLNDAINYNRRLTPADFDGLTFSGQITYDILKHLGIIEEYSGVNGARVSFNSLKKAPERWDAKAVFSLLDSWGVTDGSGVIQVDALRDADKMRSIQSYFLSRGSDVQYHRLVELLNHRSFYFSNQSPEIVNNEPLVNALSEFEALSENVLNGLTSPTTPMYARVGSNGKQTVSPYVIGGYKKGASDNSLFIRINQQKLQQDLAKLVTLQTRISAILTAVFSIADMTSSIAAKLGEGASSAGSSARQRQKIVQSFNSYTSGLNQAINSLTDIFQTTVDKTNESRYQTGLAKIDEQYAKVDKQLGDAYFASEYKIRGEKYKAKLQQDYYSMLHDNRKSMQSAMIDVPQFGSNVLPSYFSAMLWDQTQDDTKISSMHVWSALLANGIVDQFGMISPDVDLKTVSLFAVDNAEQAAGLQYSPTNDEGVRMKGLVDEQFKQFLTRWQASSADKRASIEAGVRRQLQSHQDMVQQGVGLGVLAMSNFDNSAQLHGMMDLMAREDDENIRINFDALANSNEVESTHNIYGADQMVSLNELQPFVGFQLTYDAAPYSEHKAHIEAVLMASVNQNIPITAQSFTAIPTADQQGVITALVDQNILIDFGARGHRVKYEYIRDHQNSLTASQLMVILKEVGYVSNNSANVIYSNNIDMTAVAPKALSEKLNVKQVSDLQQLLLNKKTVQTLHLSQSASAVNEQGAGFQIANVDVINVARKNFMLMTMSRRIFMTLASAYVKLFEQISKKLDGNATSSSHYGDWQSSLMESHLSIAERQLSSVHSSTIQMTERINEMHKLRLNLVKMADPFLRAFDMTSTWGSLVGALLMLTPSPLTHVAGIFITMASAILSLAQSYRGHQLERDLHQMMDAEVGEFDQMKHQVNAYFNANMPALSSSEFTTSATQTVDTDIIPRSVVDYTNAHTYINPDDPAVQALLTERIFANGVPQDPTDIIDGIHQFMAAHTTYVADGPVDDWAPVGEVAKQLRGDCEDLIHLEHSLILAALADAGLSNPKPKSHAAYVSVNGKREGHVYMTVEIDGETVVLDPSLASGQQMALFDYQSMYDVEDVFSYSSTGTTIHSPTDLGLQTDSFLEGLVDGVTNVGADFVDTVGDIIGVLLPDEFFEMFIPDFSDGTIFENRFHVETGMTDEQIIESHTRDAIELMFEAFTLNLQGKDNSFTTFMGQSVGALVSTGLKPLIMAFLPGAPGHSIATGTMNILGQFVGDLLGDTFAPDREAIKRRLRNSTEEPTAPLISGSGQDILDKAKANIGNSIDVNNAAYQKNIVYKLLLGSPYLAYQKDVDDLLLNHDRLTPITQDHLTFLYHPRDRQALFNELKTMGYIKSFYGNDYVVPKQLTTSAGPTQSSQGSFQTAATATAQPTSLQMTGTITGLMDSYKNALMATDNTGLISQGLGRGIAFDNSYLSMDANSQRVMLNQYNIGQHKDHIRILQEKMRFMYQLVKTVADVMASLAAQVGDQDKAKVASGLQKIFETSFGLVSVDMQLYDHLLSHYESATNHNVQVTKSRMERVVDTIFKSLGIFPMMYMPKFGQLVDSSLNIVETMTLYYDFEGINPLSEKYIHTNHFNSDGYIQTLADERFAASSLATVAPSTGGMFHDERISNEPLTQYRKKAFSLLRDAAKIQPMRQGQSLSLFDNHLQTVDYNAFNAKRTELIHLGMATIFAVMKMMMIKNYMSSLTKSLRGDGKVSGDGLGDLISVIEREISHDIEELGRIQSMQSTAVSLNNQKYNAVRRVERVVYEGVFFTLFLGAKRLGGAKLQMLDIILVKTLANMFQGIMLSYFNFRTGLVKNELEDELAEDDPSSPGRVVATQTTLPYSGVDVGHIMVAEANYLGFSKQSEKMIFDEAYDNNWFTNSIGLGYQSVNWLENAYQNMLLKQLFAKWNALIKAGQSVAEAYQAVADDLGAVTASLGYSGALRGLVSMKKSLMTKNLGNRFSLAGEIVGVFNSIQKERFETFQQFLKVGVLKGLQKYSDYRSQQKSTKMQLDASKAGGWGSRFVNAAVYNGLSFFEDIFRVGASAARRSALDQKQATVMRSAEVEYSGRIAAGSYTERMMYLSNVKKAKQKINADLVGKIKYFDSFFSNAVRNLVDKWSSAAQNQGKLHLGSDGQLIANHADGLAKSIVVGDGQDVQRRLAIFSAYLSPKNDAMPGVGVAKFGENLRRSFVSVFSRKSKKEYAGSLNQLERTDSIWRMLRRAHKQMVRYGGLVSSGEFKLEMQTLAADIKALHEINLSRQSKNVIVQMDQLDLIQRISGSINNLSFLLSNADDYRRQSSKVAQFFHRIRNPHIAQLQRLAANITHFAVFATASTVVNINPFRRSAMKADDTNLLKSMAWLHQTLQESDQRVHQNLAQLFTRMSHHQGERHHKVVNFYKDALSDESEERNELKQSVKDFAKRLVAINKGGAKTTYDLVRSLSLNKDQQMQLLLNGSDGIIDTAFKMGNGTGARRLLHGLEFFSSNHDPASSFMPRWIASPQYSKTFATSLNKAAKSDKKEHAHGLGDGLYSSTTTHRRLGWRYNYSSKLKARFNQTLQEVLTEKDEAKKTAGLVGLAQFVMALGDGYKTINKDFKRLLMPYLAQLTDHDFAEHNVSLTAEFSRMLQPVDDLPSESNAPAKINENNKMKSLNQLQPRDAEKWLAEFNKSPRLVIKHLKQRFDAANIMSQLLAHLDNEALDLSRLNATDKLQLIIWGCPFSDRDNMKALISDIDWRKLTWSSADLSHCKEHVTPALKDAVFTSNAARVTDIFKTVPATLLQPLFYKMSLGLDDASVDEGQYQDTRQLPPDDHGTVFDREINNEGDLNHIKALVPSLLEYQPDLAVRVMEVHADQLKHDFAQHVSSLASLTNWLISTQSLIQVYNAMRSQDKAQFLNYVLIQDDTSGQRFFSALNPQQKKDVHNIINDHVGSFSQFELEKAIFYLFGYTDATFKSLSPSQRQELIQTQRFRTKLITKTVGRNGHKSTSHKQDVNSIASEPEVASEQEDGDIASLPSEAEVGSQQEDGDIAEFSVPSEAEVGSQQEDGDIAESIVLSEPEVASQQEDGDITESIVPSDPEVGSQQEDGAAAALRIVDSGVDSQQEAIGEGYSPLTEANLAEHYDRVGDYDASLPNHVNSSHQLSDDTVVYHTETDMSPWYYFGEDRDPFSYTTRDPYRLSDAFNYDDVSQMLAASPDRDKFLHTVERQLAQDKEWLRNQVTGYHARSASSFNAISNVSDRIQRAGAFVKSEGYPVRIYERITSLKAELAASPSDESVGKITDSIIDLLNVEKQDFEYVLRWEIFSMLQQPNVKEALNEIFNNDAFLPFKQRLVKSLALHDASFIKQDLSEDNIAPEFEKALAADQLLSNRVESLVGSAILRETHHQYRPVSELLTQFSLIPDSFRDAALKGILDQFNALAGNHQMASAARMLDVAVPLYHSQINQSMNSDQCKAAMRRFLETLMGNSVQLSKSHKQLLLQTLHHCSTLKEPFKDFFKLEQCVGRSAIANYFALYEMDPTSLPRHGQLFLHGLRSRYYINDATVDAALDQAKEDVGQQVESDISDVNHLTARIEQFDQDILAKQTQLNTLQAKMADLSASSPLPEQLAVEMAQEEVDLQTRNLETVTESKSETEGNITALKTQYPNLKPTGGKKKGPGHTLKVLEKKLKKYIKATLDYTQAKAIAEAKLAQAIAAFNNTPIKITERNLQDVNDELSVLVEAKAAAQNALTEKKTQLLDIRRYNMGLEVIGQRHDLEKKVMEGSLMTNLDDLNQLQALSPTEFQHVVIGLLQQKSGRRQLFKLVTACLSDPSKHQMVHKLYDIAANDTRTNDFSRQFFKHLSRHYGGLSMKDLLHLDLSGQPMRERQMPFTMTTFILNGKQSNNRPTRLQQDLIQGFRQGFSNQYKSWMDLNHVFEMSPMVGQQGLKSFLAEMFSKDALSKSDAIILKTILFENSGNEPRWKQSFYVQFVIGRLLKSERKSSSQYGQKLLQKIRSFTAILSETEKHQFYSELSHYFKKGSWRSTIMPRRFRYGSTSYSTRAHQTRWQGLVKACTADDEQLLSHLFASMVDHSKSENTLKVMDNALRLSGARVSVNSWMSQSQVDQLSKAIHRIDPRQATNVEDDDDQSNSNPPLFQNVRDILKDVTNPYNLQINRRKNMLKAQKVQKLESVLSAYQWADFLRSYAKYARNFEVERTSSMGVSHVSGSLSIGT